MMIAARHIEIAQRIGDQRAVGEAGKHLNAAIEGLSQILACQPGNLADVIPRPRSRLYAQGRFPSRPAGFLHASRPWPLNIRGSG